jgi:hypothetical protein
MEYERRTVNGKQRAHRIAVGGVSAPISIVISTLIHHFWGDTMGTDFTIAVSSLASSLITVLAICFWDIRGIILSRMFKRRRKEGNRDHV